MCVELLICDPVASDVVPCKGRYYRASVSVFIDSSGNLSQRKTLRLLKRKSCKGCEKCGWYDEDIRETLTNEWFDNIEDGIIYQLCVDPGTRDYETGYYDDYELYLEEVKE